MTDELTLLRSPQHRQISKDQFNKWRRDPVTTELLEEIEFQIIEVSVEPVSFDPDVAMSQIQRREGYKALYEEIRAWKPDSVQREIAQEEGQTDE